MLRKNVSGAILSFALSEAMYAAGRSTFTLKDRQTRTFGKVISTPPSSYTDPRVLYAPMVELYDGSCSLPRGTTHQNQRWSTVLSPRGSPVHVAENTQSCQYYIKRRAIESHARHQEHTRIGLSEAFPTASVRQLRWRSVMDDIPRRNRPGKCLGTALSTFSI